MNPVNDAPEILSSNYAIDENTTDVGDIRQLMQKIKNPYQIKKGILLPDLLVNSFKEPITTKRYLSVADVSMAAQPEEH